MTSKAILDLEKYNVTDIKTLSKYYSIDFKPITKLIKKLAKENLKPHYKKANMIGEHMCTNDQDPVTLEKWSDEPFIKMYFLDWDDPEKKPYTLCIDTDTMQEWVRRSENYFARWVNKSSEQPMDSQGHGGEPSTTQIYLKMPDGVTFTINSPLDLEGELVGVPLSLERIGNLAGTFGVSTLHGQEPGYRVYKLIPKSEYNEKGLIKMFREMIDLNKPTTLRPPIVPEIEEESASRPALIEGEFVNVLPTRMLVILLGQINRAKELLLRTQDERIQLRTRLEINNLGKLFRDIKNAIELTRRELRSASTLDRLLYNTNLILLETVRAWVSSSSDDEREIAMRNIRTAQRELDQVQQLSEAEVATTSIDQEGQPEL